MFPSSPSLVQVHVDLLVSVVVVVAANVVDFHGCPSSIHKCPHLSVDALQPLKIWYHVLFDLLPLLPSFVSFVEMTSMLI